MFKTLHYINVIFEEKSFSKAAQKLYLSQPSLSLTIKRFEENLGVQIFDRSTSPLGLTEEGKIFMEGFRQILAIESDLERYIDDYRGLETGTLTLGAPYLFSSLLAPKLISEFKKRYPNISVRLVEASSLTLVEQTLKGEIDLIIDSSEFDEELFDQKILFNESLLLAVPGKDTVNANAFSVEEICQNQHISSNKQAVSLTEFRNQEFIMMEKGHDMHKRAMTMFKNHDIHPIVIMNQKQLMTTYNLVAQQLGAAFVTDTMVKLNPVPAEIQFYKLGCEIAHRSVHIACKKKRYTSMAMKAFLEMATELLKNNHSS
ncbi:LysR family transcriptional regulator [Enterococcus sp. AZ109]|uniref:LysR family transcriptional regulator n=1 Tax=Enterococcus sp. AZ109 TaxID=2774634 RepID=UPI003F1E941E